MNVSSSLRLCTFALLFAGSQHAFAQQGQIGGGGNNAGATSATAAGLGVGPATGTSEGIGGITTQGAPAGDVTGGTAGNNTAEVFVGGNNTGGFVGGGVATQRNNNRQFRGITNTNIPTGGGAQTSGDPRRVPVSLRVSFSHPRADGNTLLIGRTGSPIQRISSVRPELRSVQVQVSVDGTATLTGTTPDANSRRLAANLIRLRPGVRRVDNQLQ